MLSKFQFKDPALVRFSFEVEENYVEQTDEPDSSLSVQVEVRRSNEMPQALVLLTIATAENNSLPFVFSCTVQSEFAWDADLPEDRIVRLLNGNAPALLLSYVRPVVASATAASPYRVFNIPFLDFTSFPDNPIKQLD